MASESNINSSFAEIESESSLPSQSTRSKASSKRTKIGDYTRPGDPERNEKGKLIYYCKWCSESTAVSTNMWRHLAKEHGVRYEGGKSHRTKEANQELEEIIEQLKGSDLGDKVLRETLDKKLIETTLIELFIVRNIGFRVVESQEFRTFCTSLNRQAMEFLPASHTTVASKVCSKRPIIQ